MIRNSFRLAAAVAGITLVTAGCSSIDTTRHDAATDAMDAMDAAGEANADGSSADTTPQRDAALDGPLTVRFANPVDGATVSGAITITADVVGGSGGARVVFEVDGATVATVTSAPYQTAWDTAAAHTNPLPAATHPIDFGYYYVESKYGDYRTLVNDYTNEFYAIAFAASPSGTAWGPDFSTALQHAADEQRAVHLNLTDPMYYDEALDRAAPYWDRVVRIELADEPSWSQTETESVIADVQNRLATRGLAARPLGVVYTRTQVLTGDGLFAAGLDWVGIEAYVDPPGSSVSADNVAALNSYVTQAKARVPADKDVVLIMQAYDRNGAWTNIPTLIDLQTAAYQLAYDDPRVTAINMFAYGRPGGTHDHLELAVAHRQIAERLFGRTVGALSNGSHRLVLRASDSAGNTASALAMVTVAN